MKESKVIKKADSKSVSKKSENKNIPAMETDAEKKGLKGPVKTTQSTWYKAFSMNGIVFKGSRIKEDDAYQKHSIKTYNEKGSLISQQCFHEDRSSHIYLSNGERIPNGSKEINADGIIKEYTTGKFNEQGKVVEWDHFNSEDILISRSIFKYDEKMRIVELVSYYLPVDQIYSKHIMEYDETGFRVESKAYDRENILTNWHVNINNEKGHSIDSTNFNVKDGSIERHETKDYTYNEEGIMIGCNGAFYIPDGFGETYEYEYDQNGSWIKKIIFLDNVAINIVLRAITYYGEESLPEIKNKNKK
jgi:hypothetical protein